MYDYLEELDDILQLKSAIEWKPFLNVIRRHCIELEKKMRADLRHGRYEDARCALACIEDHQKILELFTKREKDLLKQKESQDGN